jgi:transcriptional regulator with GAF, ATPase, and Fis domain/serine/threonine protein kinase
MPPRYEPVRILGAGGGGEVWEVRDRITGARLALKILNGHAGGQQAEALVREFVTLSALEGLGLPRVLRFGRLTDADQPYVLRELIPGQSLDQVIANAPVRALHALAQIADQLTILHRVGVLHGDIKPANVICRDAGPATLVDFGLASHFAGKASPHGLTPRYAAPELFAGQPLTVRAEVYALGLILCDISEQLGLDDVELSVIDDLAKVVVQATATEAHSRFPSADEFAAALRTAADLPEEVTPQQLRLAWPILGIDGLSAQLLARSLALTAGESLSIQGVTGSGKTVLLRKLAWSLGVAGESVFYVDSELQLSPLAFADELSHAAEIGVAFVLIDDATRLSESQRLELTRLVGCGARLVVVGTWNGNRPTGPLHVPPLDRPVASELLRRAVPSITDHALEKILDVSQCRPLALRQWVSRIAEGTLSNVDEVLQLQKDPSSVDSDTAKPSLSLLRSTLDKGQFKEAAGMLEKLSQQYGDSSEWAVASARLQLGLGEPGLALLALQPFVDMGTVEVAANASDIWLCWARASLGVGEYSAAVDAAIRVSDAEPLLRAEALIQQGLGECYLGRIDVSCDVITKALTKAELLGSRRVEALAQAALGFVAQRTNRLDDALDHYQSAIRAGQDCADLSALANAELNLAGLLKMRGDIVGAIEHFEAAVDRGQRAGRLATVRHALLNLANMDLFLGRLARAKSRLDALRADDAELQPAQEAQRLGLEAELESRLGHAVEAQTLFAQCSKAYQVLGREADAAEASLEAILVATRDPHANFPRLRAEIERVRARLGDAPAHRALLSLAEGRVAFLSGNEDIARNAIEQAVQCARDSNHKDWLWRALEAKADLEQAAGGLLRARHYREEALTLLEEMAASLPRDLREVYWNDPRRRQLQAAVAPPNSTQRALDVSPMSPVAALDNAGAISTWLSNPIDQRLARILEINAELASDLNLERLTERIIETAVRLSGAELGLVILREPDGSLRVQSSRATLPGESRVRFSTSIAEAAISSGQPVVTLSARDDQRMSGWASVHELMVQSVACVPVRAGKTEIIGALYLETRLRAGTRFQSELPMLQAFADQVAIALHSAQLIQENQTRSEQLGESNRQLREAQDRLQELLGSRTQQLQRTRRKLKETRETLYSHFGFHGLVGTSAAMRRLYALIERVQSADVALLITGESGTGKEMVARAIHAASDRSRGPFVGVNCGAIPENLLESELFGSVRGAFTGADRDRAGLFREGQGGTLLLDEIGEMPSKMQAGLLRVLQTKMVRPVGGSREEPVDVRVICATHRNLLELVKDGRFREDLYYRIHVVELWIAPLREHAEDIPQLVNHFLGLFSAKFRQERKTVSRDALRLLMGQPWRGNVRELEHVLLNAWIMSDADELNPKDFELPEAASLVYDSQIHADRSEFVSLLGDQSTLARSDSGQHERSPLTSITAKKRSGTDERERILEALRACDHNKVKAAQMIGIPRRTFYRRLEAYGIK